MRCPACNAESDREAPTCASCGAPLGRRPRRRGIAEEADTPFGPDVEEPNRPALRAYRLSVWGLIPPLGLILGPLAVVLGSRARARARTDPDFTAWGPVLASIILGALVAVTNWAGVVLMILGLREAFTP
jgi:hypothetical protein